MFARPPWKALLAVVLTSGLTACGSFQAQKGLPVGLADGSTASVTDPAITKISLLYVSSYNDVVVFSYPDGKRVQTLTGFQSPGGLCVDGSGNVFVTNLGGSDILEYAHGGSEPIARLADDGLPNDCSVDPTTGNLAAANLDGSVAVYPGGKGPPKHYSDRKVAHAFCLGYDEKGDLFVDGENKNFNGFAFAELVVGSKAFTNITLNQSIGFPGGVKWDGQRVAVADQSNSHVYRFIISGNTGLKQRTVRLHAAFELGPFWIRSPSIIAAGTASGDVMFWGYPSGGNPTKTIAGLREPFGVAVSPGTDNQTP